MNKLIMLTFLAALIGKEGRAQRALPLVEPPHSFYELKAQDIEGKEVGMDRFKGHKVLVVNTASRCGHTPQYARLEKLYEAYASTGFVIVGFPSNDFLGQEPGSNSDIAEFCTQNYGVTFPMMSKVDVKGRQMHPVYQWLTNKAQNGVLDSKVKWNFQKYLIDEQGRLIAVFAPGTDPLSEEVVSHIRPPVQVAH